METNRLSKSTQENSSFLKFEEEESKLKNPSLSDTLSASEEDFEKLKSTLESQDRETQLLI
jgi:hypothetical protein